MYEACAANRGKEQKLHKGTWLQHHLHAGWQQPEAHLGHDASTISCASLLILIAV